jgi:Ni,Fe-hydrogenase I cytochrome b subunit
MHVIDTEDRFPVAYYIRLIYLPLILVTIGGMVLHNLLDFVRKAGTPEVRTGAMPAEGNVPERMMRGFRIAHLLVVISFPVLVYTGFALKYPESWWAQPVMFEEAEWDLRGWIHRGAGALLLGAFVFHLIHLMRNRQARICIAGMRPTLGDWREFRDRLRFYLGFRREPPHGVKLGYVEKSEYLAFVWGTLVMAVTGFLLWFENLTLKWLPSWVPEAATAIHLYEAILASLAILVWHFYWVIFDPAVYPMDMSWLSGKAPVSRELERQSPEEHTRQADPVSIPNPFEDR